MIRASTLLFTGLLSGCAMGSGIVPVAPGTYAMTEMRAPVRGGGPEARRVVLAEASGFCQRQGRDLLLLDLRPDGDPRGVYWPTAFDATFQCVAATAAPASGRSGGRSSSPAMQPMPFPPAP